MKKLFLLPVLALTGCWSFIPSVGPDYEPVVVDLSEVRFSELGYESSDTNLTDVVSLTERGTLCWWRCFGDDVLERLVCGSVTNSPNFKMAQSRLEQARWMYMATWAAFMPNPAIEGAWSRNELRHNNVSMVNNRMADRWHYGATTLGVGGAWQIDIFGGSRRASEAGWALYEAEGQSVRGTWLELSSRMGLLYAELGQMRELLVELASELEIETNAYRRVCASPASDGRTYALGRLETMMAETRADAHRARTREISVRGAMTTLLGLVPGALDAELADLTRIPQAPETVVAAFPLDAVRARPDVRKADRLLAEKIARVGIAKALWYPKLNLVGSVGVQSTDASNLFTADSLMSSLGPSIEWPIFHFSRIISQTRLSEERVREAALAYEQTLKAACAEVNDDYVAYVQACRIRSEGEVAWKSARKACDAAIALDVGNPAGAVALIGALEKRRQVMEAYLVSRYRVAERLIILGRSLGGGLGE